MIRWAGLLSFLILIGGTTVVSYFYADQWIESYLEEIASEKNGAKVEIDTLHLSLLNGSVSWKKLQITNKNNPMENTVETGTCVFALDIGALFSKKVIIETVTVNQFLFDTKRSTSGALPVKPKPEKQPDTKVIPKSPEDPGMIDKLVSQSFDRVNDLKKNFNVAHLMKQVNLSSIAKLDSLKGSTVEHYHSLKNQIETLKLDEAYKSVEKDLKLLDVKSIKTLEDVQKAVKTVESSKKTIDDASERFNRTKKTVETSMKHIKTQPDDINNWIKSDYNAALSIAKIPNFDTQSIGQMLLGGQVMGQLNEYLGYYNTAKSYLPESDEIEKEPTPERFTGQTIHFSTQKSTPKFWIKEIVFNGKNAHLSLDGKIYNISSDQKTVGKPTTIDIRGEGSRKEKFSIAGELNYLTDNHIETFNLSYSDIPLKGMNISNSPYFPKQIATGNGSYSADILFNNGTPHIKAHTEGKNLAFKGLETQSKNEVKNIIAGVFSNAERITADIEYIGNNISVRSNLDRLFKVEIDRQVKGHIENAKKEIRNRIESEVNTYKAKIAKELHISENEITALLSSKEALTTKAKDIADKKLKEITDHQKKQLGKKGDKLLKDLKKKFKF